MADMGERRPGGAARHSTAARARLRRALRRLRSGAVTLPSMPIRMLLRRSGPAAVTAAVLLAFALGAAAAALVAADLTGAPAWPCLLTALMVVAGASPLVYQNYRVLDSLDRAQETLHRLAMTDELTGAYNRRHFVRQLEQMAERATIWSATFSVVLIDIDQFKRINDTYGHKAGDDALRVVSRISRENLRKLDVFARYGGEEFAFLLYDTDIDQAAAITSRIQQQLDVTPVEHGAARFTLTFSAGIAGWRGAASDADGLLQAADQALYAAKRGGRNQVRVAELTPALPTPEGIYEHQRG